MSINKLISIKNPIVDAMDRLGIDHDKLIPLFTRWATMAEKEIGSKAQYVPKIAVLNIEHGIACLPSEAIHIQLAVNGDHGCHCDALMDRACSWINTTSTFEIPTFLIVDVGGDGNFNGSLNYTIQNNKLVFDHNCTSRAITIKYLAQETDCEGFYLVGENHVQAITEFIIWRYFYRMKGMNSLEYGKMNMAREEWHRECSHARALDSQISDVDRQEIVYGILHNPYIGISLSAGMHTTLDNSTW